MGVHTTFEQKIIFGVVVDSDSATKIDNFIAKALMAEGVTPAMIQSQGIESYTHMIGLPGLTISAEGAYAEKHMTGWWRESDSIDVGDYIFGFNLRDFDADEELDNDQVFDRGVIPVQKSAWKNIVKPMLKTIGSFPKPEIFEITQQME